MIFTALASAAKHKSINVITERLFYTNQGRTLISAVFGIALAFLFQKACKGDKCILIDAPKPEEIDGKVFELEGTCYKYKPKSIQCGGGV
jgi:hypothetical protein